MSSGGLSFAGGDLSRLLAGGGSGGGARGDAAAKDALRPFELGATSGWGRFKDARGFVHANTRLGARQYRDVSVAELQRVGFGAAPVWTNRARKHPQEFREPKTEEEFNARLETVFQELKARGAAYSLPADAPDSRWLRLRMLEARLTQYHEREVRAERHAHIGTVAARTALMKKFREERATQRLVSAISAANAQEALLALELGAPPNYLFHNGETLLTTFVHMRIDGVIPLAIKAGCDPQRTNLTGWTPLMIAVSDNLESVVKSLLEAGADPNRGRWFGVGNSLLAGSPPPVGTPVTMFVARYSLLQRALHTFLRAPLLPRPPSSFSEPFLERRSWAQRAQILTQAWRHWGTLGFLRPFAAATAST
jgi:hypothetical protein